MGGALARVWREAGHEVMEFGRDGGDATGSDVVLLAVPCAAIADALGSVTGIRGLPVIDATNVIGIDRPEGFASLAEYVKALNGGPVAKAFNTNFSRHVERLSEASKPPSMVYAADEEARDVTERLIRDAGYEPASAGDLSAARAVEDFLGVIFAVARSGTGPFLYHFAAPSEL
jgi:8-hydroxy-5-deazaflavin:NADPH oxidoreductase